MATVFITGANKGIGLELAKQLHARGDTIHATCRSSSPELDALGAHVHSGVDVREPEAHLKLQQALEGIERSLQQLQQRKEQLALHWLYVSLQQTLSPHLTN